MSDKPKILLAEDEELIAMMLEDVLGDVGYIVVSATTLNEGLLAADRESFDAAVLDVNLGREEVFPLAAKLRDKGVPFLFASGYGNEHVPLEFRDHEVLLKPYDTRTMLAAVSRLLRKNDVVNS